MAEHIARISYGKDSLKMLEVIHSRGLPLDRITTTDVWATDTISANLPPMDAFKARMDERIWQLYRIQVEHLCATIEEKKATYESVFYSVPERKENNTEFDGFPRGFPFRKGPWCQKLKHIYVQEEKTAENVVDILASHLTNAIGSASSTPESVRPWSSLALTRICAVCTASITICLLRPMKPLAGTVVGSATTRA